MSNKALAKSIIWMMGGAILLTVIMVVGTLAWTSIEHNRKAETDSVVMMRGGLESLSDGLRAMSADYSIWDAAYENAAARDVAWLSDNMGTGVTAKAFDLLSIAWPGSWETMTWEKSTGVEVRDAIIPQSIVEEVHAELQRLELGSYETAAFAVRLVDGVFLVSGSRIEPEEPAPGLAAASLPITVMGKRIDEEVLKSLGATYLIDDLRLADQQPPGSVFAPLLGLHGDPVAFLVWTPPRPGAALIATAATPLAVALMIFVGLSVTVTGVARRNTKELVAREGESARIARTDTLTGLPNRLAFNEHMQKQAQNPAVTLAILFMDVNGFKRVNDTLGHAAGDDLILQLSEKMNKLLPDHAFLARVGGDEFNVVFFGGDSESSLKVFCDGLCFLLRSNFVIHGTEFQISISIGYAVAALDSLRISDLIRRADLAMYEAKNLRCSQPFEYHPGIETDNRRKKQIEDALRKALASGDEFEVHYQPIVDASTGEMRLAEALIRWTSRDLGRMSPDRFIPIAESSGLIGDIGRWVLGRVCRDLRAAPELKVSVNVSPAQLRSPDFYSDVADILRAHDISPERIEFELTEGLLVDDPEVAAFRLDQLREAGHPVSLDDFGTGFSSIGYLKKMHFTKLKIDKTFVDGLALDPKAEKLLSAMALMARSFDLEIVAEGIECEAQYEKLKSIGYDLLQGYYINRPMPFDALIAERLAA